MRNQIRLLILSAIFLSMHSAALADELSIYTRQQAAEAAALVPRANSVTDDGPDAFKFTSRSGQTLGFTSQEVGANSDSSALPVDYLKSLSSNPAAQTEAGMVNKDRLSDTNSVSGQAVQSYVQYDTEGRPQVNAMKNEFVSTNSAYPVFRGMTEGQSNEFAAMFNDCDRQTEVVELPVLYSMVDRYSCEKLFELPVGECTLTHDWDISLFRTISGDVTYMSCGDGCLDIKMVGQAGSITVLWPGSITQANIRLMPSARQWLTHYGIYVNGRLYDSWFDVTRYDVTAEFASGQINFVRPSGFNYDYAKFRVLFDPSLVEPNLNQPWSETTPGCFDRAKISQDGFCSITLEPDVPMDVQCVEDTGTTVCQDQMPPSPMPGVINPLARQVKVISNGCDIGSSGETCVPYQNSQACVLVRSECLDDAIGASGTCYAADAEYECTTNYQTTSSVTQQQYSCGNTELRCLGNDCFDTTQDTPDMAEMNNATAWLAVADSIPQQMDCVDNGIGGQSCKVFTGEREFCSRSRYSLVNCCSDPNNIVENFTCSDADRQLAQYRKAKRTHYVGSYCNGRMPVTRTCTSWRYGYCVFDAPLSRILQEQIRSQMNISWGSVRAPSCGGLALDVLAEVDWTRIDLSEFIGIIQSDGTLDRLRQGFTEITPPVPVLLP